MTQADVFEYSAVSKIHSETISRVHVQIERDVNFGNWPSLLRLQNACVPVNCQKLTIQGHTCVSVYYAADASSSLMKSSEHQRPHVSRLKR